MFKIQQDDSEKSDSHNEFKQEEDDGGDGAQKKSNKRRKRATNSIPVLSSLIELKSTVDHAPELLWTSGSTPSKQTAPPTSPSTSTSTSLSDPFSHNVGSGTSTASSSVFSFESNEEVIRCDALGTPWWTADWSPSFPGQSRSGSGFLMTFGRSDHGKLGHGIYLKQSVHHKSNKGESLDNDGNTANTSFMCCDVPKTVKALAGVSLKNINSLSTHSVALTEVGYTYETIFVRISVVVYACTF